MTEKIKKKKFTFGPVPSRRLGRSLGIDFVPFKTCTYDCVYCQLGRTTNKTIDLKEYSPVDDIIDGVRTKLQGIPRPDYITLSGSGEPTLHSRVRDIIQGIKGITDIPVAVLTNGSLFWIDEVRNSVLDADLIIPSLDGGDAETFLYVNRPHQVISFDKMIRGLIELREQFDGPIWLEVFLIKGVTDGESELVKIKTWIDRIVPDVIQLNTAVRTPAEDFVDLVKQDTLEDIARFLGPRCEIIADYSKVHRLGEFKRTRDDVLDMLVLRPCSIDDISGGLDLHRNEVIKYVEELLDQKLIRKKKQGERILYHAIRNHDKRIIHNTNEHQLKGD
ncbi:MAG: radical SAM protein [Deltaproteobacteria bacterium]|nr:radical SAM protein [Deltaproteobacteria bacterium]